MIHLNIPTPLRPFVNGKDTLTFSEVGTVASLLDHLVTDYEKLKTHLFTPEGSLRKFINIYVGDDDIRFLNGLDTILSPDAEVSIIPSIAGGY
ncbi:MAG: MoaD/ThiS family protein [bacterium]